MTSPPLSSVMEPLSARIPKDLYLWLAQLELDGAGTNSDKLRILLNQLRRQHDGSLDYRAAHAWLRDLLTRQRDSLARLDGQGAHSEVLALLLEHLTAAFATLLSHPLADERDAIRLEAALVRRALGMGEALLRQAVTPEAAALDPQVVHRHLAPTLALAGVLSALGHGPAAAPVPPPAPVASNPAAPVAAQGD